jgi:hypothetical protein
MCSEAGCTRSSAKPNGKCISHGGGRRCLFSGCMKGARGATNYCVRHGGGRRCAEAGCSKCAQSPSPFCRAHENEFKARHSRIVNNGISNQGSIPLFALTFTNL